MQKLTIRTSEREQLVDITRAVQDAVRESGVADGVVHLWSMHTTCGLTVNEGADPDVARDIARAMRTLVPQSGDYRHAEGNSDSHIKTSLFGPGLTLLIDGGNLVLGTWQKVFLAEWDGARIREIGVVVMAAG